MWPQNKKKFKKVWIFKFSSTLEIKMVVRSMWRGTGWVPLETGGEFYIINTAFYVLTVDA